MGMYTELNMAVSLVSYTPETIIEVLNYMLAGLSEDHIRCELPDHPLFKTDRWNFMLCCDSAYFEGQTHSDLSLKNMYGERSLTIRCNLKNYDSEIELFLDWLSPYIKYPSDGFIGYMRYEEDYDPTLIYNTYDGIELLHISREDHSCRTYKLKDFSVDLK